MKHRAREAACVTALMVALWLPARAAAPQQLDQAAVLRSIDAAVSHRFESVQGFTAVERYAVYRNGEQSHPIAEMTVRDTYKKGVGKDYTILSETGSSLVLRVGLRPLLDNEKTINLPGNVEQSWFDTSNYEMKLKPGGTQKLNGRDCFVLDVAARRKATNTINGTLWVEAQNGMIVRLDGIATSRPSVWAGPTHMMRDYVDLSGFAMATHARAESDSMLVGRIVVTIDYSDYHLLLKDSQ
jgi:hypothetical protein